MRTECITKFPWRRSWVVGECGGGGERTRLGCESKTGERQTSPRSPQSRESKAVECRPPGNAEQENSSYLQTFHRL